MNEIPAINCSEPRYKSRFSSSHFSLFLLLLLLLLHKTISREMHSHLFISSLPAYNNASSPRFKHGSLPGCVGLKLMEANGRRCSLKLQTASNLKFSIDINELRHIKRPSSIHYTTPKATDVSAAFDHACESESNVDCSKSLWSIFANQINAFYRFTRPHTIIGTIVGITSVSLLPVESFADLSLTFYTGLLKALVPALLMNIYVVGLNQLFDVDIDKINKPNLPLASGEFSMGTGITIVAVSGIMSFVIGWMSQSPPLFFALLISFLLGSAYSINLPFLRWKRHAFLAASCILCVRAVLVQIAFFLHMKRCVLGREALLTKSVIFATIFMCFFSAVIALFKDIPDVDGDRDFGIQSFSVRLGQERVFWLCIKLLLVAYAAAIFVGACSSNIHQKLVTISGHGFLAAALWVRARSLDLRKKASIISFYMFIWKLFYAEYFLIPFVH